MIVRPGRTGFRSPAVGFGAAAPSAVNTASLALLNGTDGATSSTDEIPTVSLSLASPFGAGSPPELDTAFKKHGTASLRCIAAFDGLKVTNVSLDYSGDFTVECWYRVDQDGTMQIYARDDSSNDCYIVTIQAVLSSEFLGLYAEDASYVGFLNNSSSVVPVADTNFHHVAFVHHGSNWHLYYDGVRGVNVTDSSTIRTPTNVWFTAQSSPGAQGFHWDTVRFSSVARYTGASFTPSATEFTVD